MDTAKEDQILINHLLDLAEEASTRYCYVYSNFLSMGELSLFESRCSDFSWINYRFDGGHDYSDRKVIGFYNDFCKEEKPEAAPIDCLVIAPVMEKFSDNLSHRDFLGALLNLGIERGLLGDLIIQDNRAYVFCLNHITDFIIQNLTKVKHTRVKAVLWDKDTPVFTPKFNIKTGTVTSIRLDSIIALAFSVSRTNAVRLIGSESVFVNGRCVISNSCSLKDGDIISVRGFGKFIFESTDRKSRKDKFVVNIHVFI